MLKKIPAAILLPVFILTSVTGNSQIANAQAAVSQNISDSPRQTLPLDLERIEIPKALGTLSETHQVKNTPAVILIQDAHSIPDAQRSIYRLIEHFQKNYGVDQVALEGASVKLNPQFLRSFPDQKRLQKILNDYFDKAEISGVSAAALMSPYPATYQGIEDWELYEQGVELYREAMKHEKALSEALNVKREALKKEKKKVYTKALLEIDQALEKFYENQGNLIEVLKVLAKYEKPEGELGLILKKTEGSQQKAEKIELEVKRVAAEVDRLLRRP
ncbi:MAG: hypothetical protein EXS63_07490, partial [Candidatus Omnitrophica bacterium]|nr:hypothetical protein [Candidatus Omnitrophota bacterium]